MPIRLAAITEQKKKRRIAMVAIVAIFVAMISIFRTQCDRTPTMDESPFIAQGEVVAGETAKVLGNKGTIVVLAMELGGTMADTTELQLTSFLKALKKTGTVTVVATETFRPAPYVDSDSAPAAGVSGEFFLQLLRKHPGASAIVSFAGAPLLKDEQIGGLGANVPRIIVAGNVGIGPRGALKKLFDANLVLFAVTPRTTTPPVGAPKTTREMFDKFYQIVTPNNAGEMPASS